MGAAAPRAKRAVPCAEQVGAVGADEAPDVAANANHSSMLWRCRLQDADEPCLVAVREAALRA